MDQLGSNVEPVPEKVHWRSGEIKPNLYIGKWVSIEAVWMCYHASDHTVGLTGPSYLYIGW